MDVTAAKRKYYKEYRKKNADKINAAHRNWCSKNPEKVKQYSKAYWERKAADLLKSQEQK